MKPRVANDAQCPDNVTDSCRVQEPVTRRAALVGSASTVLGGNTLGNTSPAADEKTSAQSSPDTKGGIPGLFPGIVTEVAHRGSVVADKVQDSVVADSRLFEHRKVVLA